MSSWPYPGTSKPERGVVMAEVVLDMAVSLDGFVAGPGGADAGLYDWYLNPSEVSRPVIEDLVATTGAIVMGRGAFATGKRPAAGRTRRTRCCTS
jgi:dihydrofolate reductase